MCGVLKKSILAYLKFHICIPKIHQAFLEKVLNSDKDFEPN